MSTRTDWGYFDKAGAPVAVGDEHAKWQCPLAPWECQSFEHPIDGSWVEQPAMRATCPFKSVGVKLDRCTKCAMEFRYP